MLEEAEQLEPRVSALEEDMDGRGSPVKREEEEDEKVRAPGSLRAEGGRITGMEWFFCFVFKL